jgi:hypothetical protein
VGDGGHRADPKGRRRLIRVLHFFTNAVPHVETKTFEIRLELRREFPDDYDGDDDGYAWTQDFPPLAADLVRALKQVVARHPGWRIRTANRGRSSEDEVMFVLDHGSDG